MLLAKKNIENQHKKKDPEKEFPIYKQNQCLKLKIIQ